MLAREKWKVREVRVGRVLLVRQELIAWRAKP
jgi:hypothetical protein